MACWLTVYCKKPCVLTTRDVQRELDRADLLTLAEAHEIDEAAAENAEPRFEPEGPLAGASLLWRDVPQRPIQVHHWTEPGRVAEELAEARERDIPDYVDLAGTVEIVALEMGISAYEDLGIVLAWELARVVAHACDGFARDDDDRWSYVDADGGWVHP